MYKKIKNNKNKIKILFASTVLIVINFISYPSFYVPMSSFDESSSEIKSAGSYSPISIDDLPSSSTDWSWAETRPWFGGGSGTPSDPYILEDLIIDGGGIDNCILIQNSLKHFIIRNCTVYNSGTVLFASGILLFNVSNSQILGNNASNNEFMGIALLVSNHNVVSGNFANNNTNYGIILGESHNNTVSDNIANENLDHGIYIGGSQDNTILDNYAIKNGGYGIRLDESSFNSLSGNTANNNTNSGFYLYDSSNNNTLIENYGYYNGNNGIYCVDSINNVIENTIAHYNTHNGIYLQNSNNTIIIDNELSDSIENGIKMGGSHENWIEGTIANDNGDNGIFNVGGDLNTLKDTIALDNGYNGIYCGGGDFNMFKETIALRNGHNGIFLQNSNDNIITKNLLSESIENGLKFLTLCQNNSAYSNILHNNELHGFLIQDNSDNNLVYDNLIYNNSDTGIFIETGSDDILIYDNFLLRNMIHALDSGSSNDWIGNYWDNWTSPDTDHNGIVDIPYTFIKGSAGSIDPVPIAEDGAPWISINLPNNFEVFGSISPDYSVTIIDVHLYEMWYTLDGGLNNYSFDEFNGNIDQSAWDALTDGEYTLTFYASDKAGNIAFEELNIKKDTQAPTIIIVSPVSTDLFISAPSFIVEILDQNLDAMWYSLDGGLTNYTFNNNGTINQALWETLPEGTVTITFYAKDLVGHLSFGNVSFTKTSGFDPILMIIIISSTIGGVVVIIGVLMFLRKRRKPGVE